MADYECWQFCDGVTAVKIHAVLVWKEVHGRREHRDTEPVHLLDGDLPADEAGRAALVERIKEDTVNLYRLVGAEAHWEAVDEAKAAKSAPVGA